MSSPKPYSEDELDRIVRGALQARVGGQETPEHVWKRIRLELEADQSSPQRRLRMAWPPLVVQAVLTSLLVILAGVSLQVLLGSGNALDSSYGPLRPVATVNVVERPVPSSEPAAAEERDLYLLKTQYRFIARSDAEPKDGSSEISPLERHSVESESSPPIHPAKERKLIRSGL